MANQMTIKIYQTSETTSEAEIRQHRLLIDRPESKGGYDRGPMGGELFLAAVGGCFTSTLLAAIKTRDAAVSGVRVEVTGTLVENPTRFAAVEVCVAADHGEREQFKKLVEIAEKGCIIVNTLRDKLELRVRIAE